MSDETPSWLGRLLNAAGAAAVAYSVWLGAGERGDAPWIGAVASAGVLVWLVAQLLPGGFRSRAGAWLPLPMVVAGALVVVPTNGVTIVVIIIAVIGAMSDLRRPLWLGLALAALGAVISPIGVFFDPTITPLGVLSIEGGILVAVLLGVSRRQFRAAAAQARLLAEERLSVREEQARGAALAERQRVAREIHDVLAHSLGGLVIQLDAVEALLEAGRDRDARTRVSEARSLAASGLDEARRAVGALRAPRDEPQPGEELVAALADLVEVHRGLGGRIRFETVGTPHDVAEGEAQALRRTMQEALTNARKHAAGAPVSATLRFSDAGVELEIDNPLVARRSELPPSGQHGLVGMSERFAELEGASLTAGPADGRFVVTARVGAP